MFQKYQKGKGKSRAAGYLGNRRTERTPRKFLDTYLNIISFQNFQVHQNRMRNGESKYVLMKEVIVPLRKNAKTEKIK